MANITPDLLAQLDALTANWGRQAPGMLSPELLALLESAPRQDTGWGQMRGVATPDGRTLAQYAPWASAGGVGESDGGSLSGRPDLIDWSQAPIDLMLNTDTSNLAAQFGANGAFSGFDQREDNSSWRDFLTAAAMIAGGYFGGGALADWAGAAGAGSGAGAGGTAGGTAAAGGSSITLPTTAEMAAGMAPASASTAATAMPAVNIAGGATAGAAAGTAGTSATTKAGTTAATSAATQGGGQSGASDFRQGEIGSYQSDPNAVTKPATTGGNMTDFDRWWEGMKQAVGTGAGSDPAGWTNAALNFLGNNSGGILGAISGYLDSKDKEQTSKTEPWGPAKPYLEGLLREGGNLWGEYQKQPFSPAEQTAYGNYGNVLDFINGNAGGLMSGFDATAAGRNQFSRSNPRRQLIGNSYDAATSPVAWEPSLLGNFGTKKGGR